MKSTRYDTDNTIREEGKKHVHRSIGVSFDEDDTVEKNDYVFVEF
jgi:hypothetical protein